MLHAADTGKRAACNRQRASDSRRHAGGREHMRDATGNTRHCRISCAASSGQRTTSSMREALFSTTSAQHGTGAAHKMQHTTGAAACSKHTRSRQHAAGNAMNGMRDETKGSRKLAHLDAASGSLRRPRSGGWIIGVRGVGSPYYRQYCGYECNPCELRASLRLDCDAALVRRQLVS